MVQYLEAVEGPVMERSHEDNQQLTSDMNVEKISESSDEIKQQYPSGIKLTFIFVALCLTVFLVALVCAAYLPHLYLFDKTLQNS